MPWCYLLSLIHIYLKAGDLAGVLRGLVLATEPDKLPEDVETAVVSRDALVFYVEMCIRDSAEGVPQRVAQARVVQAVVGHGGVADDERLRAGELIYHPCQQPHRAGEAR